MQLNYKSILGISLSIFLCLSACSTQKKAAKGNKNSNQTAKKSSLDLTGPWTFTIQTPVGNRDTPVELKQIDEKTAEGSLMDMTTIFTIKNDSIFYGMERDTPIGKMDMKAMGSVNETEMDGIYRIVGGAMDGIELTWSAKKN